MRILFVDDQKDFLELLAIRLRDQPYEIALATSGDGAWLQLQNDKIDVLISDINMPGLSGIKLFEMCAASYPCIARVGFSSINNSGLILEMFNNELIHRYLTKPWRADRHSLEQIVEFCQFSRQLKERLTVSRLRQTLEKSGADWRVIERGANNQAASALNDYYALVQI